MRHRTIAGISVLLIAAGSVSPVAAQADTAPPNLYVGLSIGSPGCSDAWPGTLAQPLCSIQHAADIAVPGQTVIVGQGITNASFYGNVLLTHSGSPGKPITIQAGVPYPAQTNGTTVTTYNNDAHVFTFSGVHDLVIRGFNLSGSTADTVVIDNSSDITLDQNRFNWVNLGSGPNTVSVTGTSSKVTVSRNAFYPRGGALASAVTVGPGVTNTTISTNFIYAFGMPQALVLNGATGTAVTSNTITSPCGTALSLSAAPSTSIENNVLLGTCTKAEALPLLSVAADSTSGSALDYNIAYQQDTANLLYSWAGSTYSTAAALQSATGQGAHDLNTPPGVLGVGVSAASPVIDSADANAPGELSTDATGYPRVDDPNVPNTGTGSGFYDRGAYEYKDPIGLTLSLSATELPTGATLTASAPFTDPWTAAASLSYDYGDGSAATAATTHVYTTPGWYYVTATVTNGYGATKSVKGEIHVVNPAPLTAQLSVTPIAQLALGVTATTTVTSNAWNILGCTIDFGDATNPDQTCGPEYHSYAKPGTYTVTTTVTDSGGNTATSSGSVTTSGSDFTAFGPTRLLDTRNGTGTGGVVAKISSGYVTKLHVTGIDGIPANATALALNLTATDTTSNGNLTAYPDGTTQPNTSNLNYRTGQTVANAAIIPIGPDGSIAFAAAGRGTLDLIADATGYYTATAANGFAPTAPTRILDTRAGTGAPKAKLTTGSTVKLAVAGKAGIPADVKAVSLNLTLTDTTGYGYITAYPDGTAPPTASTVNYGAGQTIANAAIVPVGPDGAIDLTKAGPGALDLIADVSGYYSPSAPDAYIPLTPTRLVDSRITSTPLAARGTATLTPWQLTNPAVSQTATYVLNATATQTTSSGYLAIAPADQGTPTTSNLNWTGPGQTVPNLVIATPDNAGNLAVYNGSAGSTHYLIDLFGYFSGECVEKGGNQ